MACLVFYFPVAALCAIVGHVTYFFLLAEWGAHINISGGNIKQENYVPLRG